MNDVTIVMWTCMGACIGLSVGIYLFGMWFLRRIRGFMNTQIELSKKLFDIRDDILKELSGKYKAELNSLTNRAYLDFLDRAYSSRFGDVNGWSFKIPSDVAGKDTIDLNLYFTDDEVTAIKKARAIYGIDKRFELFDKRLGL